MIHTFEAPLQGGLTQSHQLYKAIKSMYQQTTYTKIPHAKHSCGKCDCILHAKKPDILPNTSNYIDPGPEMNVEEEVIARQLALIGDQLVTKQKLLQDKNRNKMAAYLVVVGVAGVAMMILANNSE